MADPKTDSVHLDTQFFVTSAFAFGSNKLKTLKSHFESGWLRLVMTDITVAEVHSRIRKTVASEVVAHRTFLKQAKALHNSSLGAVKGLLLKSNESDVVQDLSAQFETFLLESGAAIIQA